MIAPSAARRTQTPGARGVGVVLCALAALAIWAPRPGGAQDATREGAQRQLEDNKQALKSTKQREESLERSVQSLETERARIASRLIETAKHVQKSEIRLTEIESRIAELQTLEQTIRGTLAQRHEQLAQLLGAMQRMGRNPPPVVVTRREDALTMVRSAMLLAAVYPEMSSQAIALAEKLDELTRVMADSRRESEQLRAETRRIGDARQRLEQLLAEKRSNLVESHAELKQARQAAADLARSITDLNELITKLDKSVAEKEYEHELAEARSREAARQQPQPPAAAEVAPPSEKSVETKPEQKIAAIQPPPKPPTVELRPSLSPDAAMLNPGRLKPAVPFEQTRASLPLPARGKRLVNFGDKTDVSSSARGIVIETRAGAQIVAPSDSWVVFAGPFRTYEQILILNAGGGYYFVLAGLAKTVVQPGQFVLAGEPLGTMGNVAAAVQAQARNKSVSQEALPAIYIELRKDGRPIDPDPWWAAEATQKVQG